MDLVLHIYFNSRCGHVQTFTWRRTKRKAESFSGIALREQQYMQLPQRPTVAKFSAVFAVAVESSRFIDLHHLLPRQNSDLGPFPDPSGSSNTPGTFSPSLSESAQEMIAPRPFFLRL